MASSSTIIACIHSVLHDAERLMKRAYYFEYMEARLSLNNLKIFVLCAEKLRNNACFGSFLVEIEDIVHQKVEEIHAYPPDALEAWEVVHIIRRFIRSLADEVNRWYLTLFGCTLQSCSLTTNEVLEIITCILENDYQCQAALRPSGDILSITVEPLKEHMLFMKNLIHFVEKGNGSIEERENLLAHVEVVAINAAYLLFRCDIYNYEFNEQSWEEMHSQISALVRKMKPVNCQVYEIYTQALSSLKLRGQNLDDGAFLTMKNFLDSLISVLWEMLQKDIDYMDPRKDQQQELYEGLRSLRAVIKKQLTTKFEMKALRKIADVVCDAGISICSFHQGKKDVELGLRHLLEAIEIILLEIGGSKRKFPTTNSPRTSSYGFVDFIVERLVDLTQCEAESTTKSKICTIKEELALVRFSLDKVMELQGENAEMQTLWNRLLVVAYEVENVIDNLAIRCLRDSFSTSLDSIIKDILNVKADVLKIEVCKVRRRTYSYKASQKMLSLSNEVVGFHSEEETILERLQRGSVQLRIVSIVGMLGSGKTTLATKVFNHPSIYFFFHVRAWCSISQVPDQKKVLLNLLKQTDPSITSEMFPEMTEHELADKLRRSLKRKRYIIFLDDIWNTETWNSLKDSFPNDTMGSRIILTSRFLDVAPREMIDKEPLILSQLSREESLELFQKKLFPENGWPRGLLDVGMQITEKCKGLPLAIIILAGLLGTIEQGDWQDILDSFSFVSGGDDYCRYTLELSYKHLPDYLKPCFLYFGTFPKDQEVSIQRLLRLWIAEGFVRKSEEKSQEDVAEDYLKILISRSLIMVAKLRYDGWVRACRIHDLLHDFCLQKAKDEHFFHFLKGRDELLSFIEPHILRRLCIESEPQHFVESKMYSPRARSLHLSCPQQSGVHGRLVYRGMSLMLHAFKLLKVLDLEKMSVGSLFPKELQWLVLLTFLAIRGKYMEIPSWIDNLSNLETFIINSEFSMIRFPDSLWNMQKMKYLCIRSDGCDVGGFLPMKNLDNSSVLYELNRFSCAMISWCNMERLLKKFPNIRKLKCKLFVTLDEAEYVDKFVFPDFLSKLASLHMCNDGIDFGVRFDFCSLTNLKKLTLSQFYLHSDIFSMISSQLPNLEFLKLHKLRFIDHKDALEMNEGEFRRLRVLHLSSLRIRRWRDVDDHEFECLQKLVLYSCDVLEELPACLEFIETLEMIEVYDCSQCVVDLAIKIVEVQKEWGNTSMKIITNMNQP